VQSSQHASFKLIAEFATVFVPFIENRHISSGMPNASSVDMDHEQVLTERIIGCAIKVHNDLGAGLLEKPYLMGLCVELAHRGICFERERVIELKYHDVRIGEYIPDLIVENKVVVEIKSVLRYEDVFTAQMLTHLRLTKLRVGLILNFNKRLLRDGRRRAVW
jgi:GxxExxY protein